MGNPYTRFLNEGDGGTSLSDSWVGHESFTVQRVPSKVNWGRVYDGPGAIIPLDDELSDTQMESLMAAPARELPSMPEIGRPESYYSALVHTADKLSLPHHHEAAKVGQYITLALDPHLDWNGKLKYFRHALARHCTPPPYPDDELWMFYQNLASLVRQQCGREALRLASLEDDLFATRLAIGQTREAIEDDAEAFFFQIMGREASCPIWINEEDWDQLKILKNQWI